MKWQTEYPLPNTFVMLSGKKKYPCIIFRSLVCGIRKFVTQFENMIQTKTPQNGMNAMRGN